MLRKFGSTDGLGPKKLLLWRVARYFVPKEKRFFFEGHARLRGQMSYDERLAIYNAVREFKPQHCFEIGTWRGGGSTLFVAQALFDNGQGQLHTIENDPEFFKEARMNYTRYLSHLLPHVEFHLGDYHSQYPPLLRALKKIDFLILDGPEDAAETISQFDVFRPHMESGAILVAHDWFTEKSRLLRPIVEESDEWGVLSILRPPISLGLVVAIRR